MPLLAVAGTVVRDELPHRRAERGKADRLRNVLGQAPYGDSHDQLVPEVFEVIHRSAEQVGRAPVIRDPSSQPALGSQAVACSDGLPQLTEIRSQARFDAWRIGDGWLAPGSAAPGGVNRTLGQQLIEAIAEHG